MKRIIAGIAGAILAAVLGGWLYLSNSPAGQIFLPSGTGITAKQVCSLTFVSGLDPDRARALYTDPLLGDAAPLLQVHVDREAETVTASALGIAFRQTAVHREGLGCTLVHDPESFDARLALPLSGGPDPMVLDTLWRDAHFDADALEVSLDLAFTADGRNTLAALVLHDGRLVAERYADGVTAETPLHGWSMTKSAAATLAGVLVQRGLMDVHAEGLVPALAANGRGAITVDDLLRMAAGLDGFETGDGFDPNSQMLFTQSDMAHYAANRTVIHAPGAHWDYQSGNTILAGAAFRGVLGGTVPDQIANLRGWLFDPLGMHHSVVEVDEAGTLQMSSYMYASARDWARLGQLYLDGGRAGDMQIIPPGWMDYVTAPTPPSGGRYGSGFWLNNPGLPQDAIMMDGFQSQRTVIIPSEDLVIVRLGATNGINEDTRGLVNAVIAARTPAALPD
jgi:CubicO group peptidase (beta-lactamase class C family)